MYESNLKTIHMCYSDIAKIPQYVYEWAKRDRLLNNTKPLNSPQLITQTQPRRSSAM